MTPHIPLATELVAETLDRDRRSAVTRRPAAESADRPSPPRIRRAMTPRGILTFFAALLLLTLVAQPGGVRAQDNPPAPAGITLDADGDGLMDEQELQIGTDPAKPDTDVDRLSDGFEVRELGTDPLRADSDEDGLGDGDELEVYKTDALAADTDGDGADDATEIDAGSDPRDAKSLPGGGNPIDADRDGLSVDREAHLGTSDVDPDSDDDRLEDGREVDEFGTDPLDPDTDNDGRRDGDEVYSLRPTNPLTTDYDGDGLADGDEVNKHNTDPVTADSDRDGFDDGVEIRAGSDPTDPKSIPSDGEAKPSPPPTTGNPAPPVKGVVATQLPNTGAGSATADNGPGIAALAALAVGLAAALVARRLA